MGTSVSAAAMSAVLRQFARDVGVGPKKRVVVVIDGAGWHKANDLEVPDGIHLVFLPPYSPELQPAERLWPQINEVVANRTFRMSRPTGFYLLLSQALSHWRAEESGFAADLGGLRWEGAPGQLRVEMPGMRQCFPSSRSPPSS